MKPIISVIICTHNPRRDYLHKVLDALKSQCLPIDKWELLMIDNASNRLLSEEIDLSWHSNARHIRENELGLTPARLRGIREAEAELLVFVDDDNVLDKDYLQVTLQISEDWFILGVWGGQIRPDFDVPPPDWTKKYWGFLAIREFERDKWSNLTNYDEAIPCGAGMCIRKNVAEKYADEVINQPKRLNLGRKGKLLTAGEDTDIAYTACDVGLGRGQFTSLKLTHLIPSHRLQEDYLIKLVEGLNYSAILLEFLRGKMQILPKQSIARILIEYYRLWQMSKRERRFYRAIRRGQALAIKEIHEIVGCQLIHS